jgi:hypothetical protein
VLHGQDGFSPDQARGFAPTPQPFLFGLCPPGGTSPICGIDPGTAPKVIDTVPPSTVDQSVELDPTRGGGDAARRTGGLRSSPRAGRFERVHADGLANVAEPVAVEQFR